MATVSHLHTTADSGTTPNTSGAFTPALNDLLVAFVYSTNTVESAPVLSSSIGGFTFSKVGSALVSASNHTIYLFIADALVSSASSQTVTMTMPTDQGTGTVIYIAAVAGMEKFGLSAVVQWTKQDNATSGITPNAIFASTVLSTNPTLGCACNLTNPAGIIEPTGWTEGGDTGYELPSVGAEYVFRNSGFTGTEITWGSTFGSSGGQLSVELDASITSSVPSGRMLLTGIG